MDFYTVLARVIETLQREGRTWLFRNKCYGREPL
jgi:hypothetical protein